MKAVHVYKDPIGIILLIPFAEHEDETTLINAVKSMGVRSTQ